MARSPTRTPSTATARESPRRARLLRSRLWPVHRPSRELTGPTSAWSSCWPPVRRPTSSRSRRRRSAPPEATAAMTRRNVTTRTMTRRMRRTTISAHPLSLLGQRKGPGRGGIGWVREGGGRPGRAPRCTVQPGDRTATPAQAGADISIARPAPAGPTRPSPPGVSPTKSGEGARTSRRSPDT
jgi:hypothetical protein